MGYQAILAGFPVFLVLALHAPAYFLGIAYALAYGIGAVFGTIGGILGDMLGRKRIAILGNTFILILPALSVAGSVIQALETFAGGWWARDFRTSSRRAMLSEATTKEERPRAFGLLHLFDIGGGAIAVGYLLILIGMGTSLRSVFAITAVPIAVSTICLTFVRGRHNKRSISMQKRGKKIKNGKRAASDAGVLRGVLISTALFGFSFYSLGFPILTIASQSGNDTLGILSYLIYLLFSAAAGYTIGMLARRLNMVKGLSVIGYLLAAAASILLALYYSMHLVLAFSYIAVALLGIAVGAIETFEPTIISLISAKDEQGTKLGYLTSSRSIGLFSANMAMGILYTFSPAYSYIYSAVLATGAAATLLYFGRSFGQKRAFR